MLVKVAPIGERVIEVNVESGTEVNAILSVAGVLHNDRSILVNNQPAELSTPITQEGAVVVLVGKMKGGK